MNLQRPFQVVAPTLDGDVLTALARADLALTGRAIEREVRASHGGVQRALEHLVAEGVVDRERAGNAFLYRLNRDHLAAPWIEGLAALRLELIERLRAAVAAWDVEPVAVVLFGSVVRDEAGRTSDLDLLIVRPETIGPDDEMWHRQVAGLAAAVTRWTGNDARVLEYGEEEVTSEEPVLRSAAEAGIEIFGSLHAHLGGVGR